MFLLSFFFFVKFVLPICESLDFIFYEILDSHSIGETEERQRQSEMVNPEKNKNKNKAHVLFFLLSCL